ncbi:MAG: chromate resistance protein [Gemmatimonadetes bacterium]|nr:MAG: chromate resistance protein [Gemmatimonadota bacterium]PYO64645.1 MAG: chromate resistance protein [Gemmatimonadota bacterium]
MKWITRERPKIDRVACPWLIARFIDRDAEFVFAPPSEVKRLAAETGAIPFDVEGVELSHDGPLCSFDALLAKYQLDDPSLQELAVIIRGADTARLDLAPQAAGLLAISLGLSHNFRDDHEQLRHGFVIYDALYAWSRHVRGETHTWNPQRAA